MREFTFSVEDLKAIEIDRYHHPHPHVQRKMEALWLKSHGLPHRLIADLAGVSLRTVQRYLDEFQEGGPEAGAPLQLARPRDGAAPTRTLRRRVLLGPPAARHQAGRK